MNKHILIIDDDSVYRKMLDFMINKVEPSIVVHHCENGKIGLEYLKGLIHEGKSTIILLDINMPVMDGWGFLKEFESTKLFETLDIKVNVVSSSTDENDILLTKKYDFVRHFYHKPLSKSDIQSILENK